MTIEIVVGNRQEKQSANGNGQSLCEQMVARINVSLGEGSAEIIASLLVAICADVPRKDGAARMLRTC